MVPSAIYALAFASQGISGDPTRWAEFGDYLAGTAVPLLALLNLGALVCVAFAIYRLETSREQQLLRPNLLVRLGDYEDDIFVKLSNLGLGPAVIRSLRCYSTGSHAQEASDLVELMPDLPQGTDWRDFTILHPGAVIAQGQTEALLRLSGDPRNPEFANCAELVRRALMDLAVKVDYEDMFGNAMTPTWYSLSGFGRTIGHDAL